MKTKRCPKCEKVKPIDDFYKNKSRKDGFACWCKNCNGEYQKNNHKRASEYVKKWQRNNPEKAKAGMSERIKRWKKNNPGKANESVKRWQRNNPQKLRILNKRKYLKRKAISKNRLNDRISSSIYRSLKNKKNSKHWEKLVGYSLNDLKKCLESQFKNNMSWGNYGSWQIDHIIPLSFFEFDSYNDWEFRYCWSLDNLQPLWEKDNLRKYKKLQK